MQTTLGKQQAASTPTLLRSLPIPGHWRHLKEYRAKVLVMAAVEGREKWVTKQQLAVHLSVTPRWIVAQQALGLPHMHMRGMNRYVVSEVEAWLREHYGEPTEEAA
jgi:hypothetical protein